MNALPKMHSTKILNFYCKILQLKKKQFYLGIVSKFCLMILEGMEVN